MRSHVPDIGGLGRACATYSAQGGPTRLLGADRPGYVDRTIYGMAYSQHDGDGARALGSL
jgi:hypothetical protein